MSKKRISKALRARIVELLRCAADWAARGNTVWLDSMAITIGADDAVLESTIAIGEQVIAMEPFVSERARCERSVMPPDWNKRVCLEAALLVEEGWTP